MKSKLDDVTETLQGFQARIAVAQMQGEEWIETSPEIINLVCKKGTGEAGYFIYGVPGIKVYEHGTRDAIEARDNEQMGHRIHGAEEGKVVLWKMDKQGNRVDVKPNG